MEDNMRINLVQYVPMIKNIRNINHKDRILTAVENLNYDGFFEELIVYIRIMYSLKMIHKGIFVL